MKKTNKILAKALVIILSLVLITSCVVSSTFAKYVVRKSAAVTVGLEKFGLNVQLTGINALGTATTTDRKGDSVSLTYDNVTLKPGDETFKNAVTASVTGTPNVPANVTIDVSVSYGGAKFAVDSTAFKNNAGTYVPIVFYVNGTGVTTAYDDPAEAEVVTSIKNGLAGSDFSNGTYSIIKNDDGSFSALPDSVNFGFVWPLNAGTSDAQILLFDQIGTYLANQTENKSTVTITYTISVEQTT